MYMCIVIKTNYLLPHSSINCPCFVPMDLRWSLTDWPKKRDYTCISLQIPHIHVVSFNCFSQKQHCQSFWFVENNNKFPWPWSISDRKDQCHYKGPILPYFFIESWLKSSDMKYAYNITLFRGNNYINNLSIKCKSMCMSEMIWKKHTHDKCS